MTDILIYKYTDEYGRWGKYFLRKDKTIHHECSNGITHTKVMPDSLINIIRLKTHRGKIYINVDALRKATGVEWI